jgi:hypothetical protein
MKRSRGGKWRIILELSSITPTSEAKHAIHDPWSKRWESRRIFYRWRRISGTRHAPGIKCTPPVDNADSAKKTCQLIQQFHSGECISI